ncbi:MAG TPA: phosphotransferase, partial [Pilimelia sp.]|nr:phosphotransferase [Pilimelia sp.]
LDEWRDWLDHPPPDASAGFLDTVRSFLPDIARARDLVAGQPPAAQRPAAVAHRDLKPDNVLLSAAGPVLVDWEGAGVDIAAWDAARTALAFSRSPDRGGRQAPFQRLLRAYGAAGGGRVPPAAGSFEGLLRHQLGASAWLLWRALGHRPVTPAERAAAHGHALEFLTDLRSTLAHLPEWVSWLAELPPAPPTGPR